MKKEIKDSQIQIRISSKLKRLAKTHNIDIAETVRRVLEDEVRIAKSLKKSS